LWAWQKRRLRKNAEAVVYVSMAGVRFIARSAVAAAYVSMAYARSPVHADVVSTHAHYPIYKSRQIGDACRHYDTAKAEISNASR
jgi:hypothetical protein